MSIINNKKAAFFLLSVFILIISAGMTAYAAETNGTINSAKDIEVPGTDIGVPATLGIENAVRERFPEADIYYYDSINGFEALKAGKIDVLILPEDQFNIAVEKGMTGFKMLNDEYIATNKVAFAISESCSYPDFENKVNSFIRESKEQGLFKDIYDRWVIKRITDMPEDIPEPESPSYTIKVTTNGEFVPYTYYEGSTLTGSEIEIARRLGAYLNAEIRFIPASWDGMITGVSTGKYDLAASELFVNEDRASAVRFSEPYYEANIGYVVRDGSEKSSGFLSELKNKLQRALIDEDRWKTLVKGLMTTLLITFGGFILANILGVIFCFFSMSDNRILNFIADIYSKIMQGTPVVVILMIIYYIIFARTNISGITVSIIGFGLTTGANLAINFKSALQSIGKGQWEGAYSLGFSKFQTFIGVIVPQAAIGLLPVYFNQLIYLMKGTAVVGYVAVTDLTKMGDLIRSATFDAFVPLITIALMYLLISTLLIQLSKFLLKKVDPRLRPRVIKGVKMQ